MKNLPARTLRYSQTDFGNYANVVSGQLCEVHISKDAKAYTYHERYYNKHIISLGDQFYNLMYPNYPKNIPDVEVLTEFSKIRSVYVGLLIHEIGHIMYTPSQVYYETSTKLESRGLRNTNAIYRQFVNLFEDLIIENEMCYLNPAHRGPIHALHLALVNFYESSDVIDIQPNIGGVVNYLLLAHKAPEYPMPTIPAEILKIKSFIDAGTKRITLTVNANLRNKYILSFVDKLIKYFDLKEDPKDDSSEKGEGDMSESSSSGSGMGNPTSDVTSNSSASGSSPQEIDGEAGEETSEQSTAAHGGSSDADPMPININQTIRQLAADNPLDVHDHQYYHIKDHYKTALDTEMYNTIVSNNMHIINQTIHTINKMKAYNLTGYIGGYYSGNRVDNTAVMRGSYKMFKKREAHKPEADLSFEIIMDNSGSMGGTKTTLCTHALIIISEVLYRMKIPFAIHCFTEGNVPITIAVKEFNEDYHTAKRNLGFLLKQTNINSINTFCGNVDEVNINYLANRYAQEAVSKDKNIIVLSDGATCGSIKTLKSTIDNIEKTLRIPVMGIGIKDDNVSKAYRRYEIFRSNEDLSRLPKFFTDYLVNKTFKQGGDDND